MLNTVLGLPKKGVSALPQNFPSKREKPTPLVTSNPNTTNGREVGKRLFESGTYKDPRLIYDVGAFLSPPQACIALFFRDRNDKRKRTNLLKHPCEQFQAITCAICLFFSFSSVIFKKTNYEHHLFLPTIFSLFHRE